MKLLPDNMQTQAVSAAMLLSYFVYAMDAHVIPSIMREKKFHACWAAASKKYHETIWKNNYSYDRELRYSAISKNLMLEHINHTQPKSVAQHVNKMIETNKKVYDAFNPSSKRLLIWQVQPSLL